VKIEALRTLIIEGGAAGHLFHLYDNKDLTFAELKQVLSMAAEGKLQRVTEKLDGVNLVFTWDESVGDVRVARTGNDISSGGMDAKALAAKFAGRGSIEKAFVGAFSVLHQAVGALGRKTRAQVFGDEGNTWYSIEVIYAKNPNVINYDSNNIVFHASPVFRIKNGKVSQKQGAEGVDLLAQNIDKMQKSVTMNAWQVKGPAVIRMKKLSDGSIVRSALAAITRAQSQAGVSDKRTINDYLRALMKEEVADLDFQPKAAKAIVERALETPGALGLNDIKKMIPADRISDAQTFIRAAPELMKKFIAPIEVAIHQFATEVLSGLQSVLISDPDKEVQRLRTQVGQAIKSIEASGHAEAMSMVKSQLEKLGDVENITAAMEGIVFIFKGNAYKFTGNFAPVNQILGLFKYGRGSFKPQESVVRTYVQILAEQASGEYVG